MSIQRRKLKDKLARLTLWIVLLLVTATLLGILGFLVARGYSALSWEFFTEPPRNGMTEGGILTPLVGTLQLIIVSMAFAFPVGVLTAIYLHEYALDNATTRSIRLAIRCLAGVPSVVFGLFGFSFFCVFLKFGTNLLSAGLTLGCLALPIIVGASETALQNVPRDYRDASFSLGATRWQTISRAVLPAALPSILTGAILSIGRVAGETAPIICCTSLGSMLNCHPRSRSPSMAALTFCSQFGERVATVTVPDSSCMRRVMRRARDSLTRSVRKSTLREALP